MSFQHFYPEGLQSQSNNPQSNFNVSLARFISVMSAIPVQERERERLQSISVNVRNFVLPFCSPTSHQSDETFHEVLKDQFRLFTNIRCYFGVFPILVAVRPRLQNRMGSRDWEDRPEELRRKVPRLWIETVFWCSSTPHELQNEVQILSMSYIYWTFEVTQYKC